MIASIRHKGLRRFFDADDRSKIPPALVERIRSILSLLDAATSIEDMDQPTLRLHPLKGDLAGYWAVTVRANWRIIFHFNGTDATHVDLVDYH